MCTGKERESRDQGGSDERRVIQRDLYLLQPSALLFKRAGLPERLGEDDGDGGCQIEAAHPSVEHRDGEASFLIGAEQFFGQTARLTAKDETIILFEVPIRIGAFDLCREVDKTRADECCLK